MEDKIISLNTQGFYEDDVNDFVNLHRPLAFVATEHKRRDLRDLDVLDGYTLGAGQPARTGQRGVAIYVRDGVNFNSRRELDSFSKERVFETASVEIPSRKLVVTGKYKSPKASVTEFNERLDCFAQYVKAEPYKKHVIAGDMNIDFQKRPTTKQVIWDNNLRTHIRSATHKKGGRLDNFITDFQPTQSRKMTAKRDQISDHSPIKMHLPRSSASASNRTTSCNSKYW